ncbi:Protein IQ-DOMAIN 1 [Capsicum chinense]|nr:Protein IQ-DOMAIN 1 [Capsicum chinense]
MQGKIVYNRPLWFGPFLDLKRTNAYWVLLGALRGGLDFAFRNELCSKTYEGTNMSSTHHWVIRSVTKLSPKKWGISGTSSFLLATLFAGVSILLNQGIDIRANISAVLGLAILDAILLGGSCLAQISSFWPPYKRRICAHEAGHLLIAYLMSCPIRGVILDPIVAMQMGIQGQAGTQFWDEKLENKLAEGRLSGTAFDRLPRSVLELSKKMIIESSRNPVAAAVEKEAGWMLLSSLLACMHAKRVFDILSLWASAFQGIPERHISETKDLQSNISSKTFVFVVYKYSRSALVELVKEKKKQKGKGRGSVAGNLARRALMALRGLVRLKSLVDGPTTKRETANALKCMQTLSQVQSQISCRRIRMLEENRAIMQKNVKELKSLSVSFYSLFSFTLKRGFGGFKLLQ